MRFTKRSFTNQVMFFKVILIRWYNFFKWMEIKVKKRVEWMFAIDNICECWGATGVEVKKWPIAGENGFEDRQQNLVFGVNFVWYLRVLRKVWVCVWRSFVTDSIMDSGGFRIPSTLRIIFSLSLLYFGEYPVGGCVFLDQFCLQVECPVMILGTSRGLCVMMLMASHALKSSMCKNR